MGEKLSAGRFQKMPNAQQVAICIHDHQFAHTPWLVFGWYKPRDAFAGQIKCRVVRRESLGVFDPQVDAVIGCLGHMIRKPKEMQFHPVAVQNKVTFVRVDRPTKWCRCRKSSAPSTALRLKPPSGNRLLRRLPKGPAR